MMKRGQDNLFIQRADQRIGPPAGLSTFAHRHDTLSAVKSWPGRAGQSASAARTEESSDVEL